jgi:outer membrane protein assembly factor BamB
MFRAAIPVAAVLSILFLPGCTASGQESGDWPMWGGTPSRNQVSPLKGMPAEWNVREGTHIKWVADLGSLTYGNPVVSGGKVFVGTNNGSMRDPKQSGDLGVLMAFNESDGEFLWQATSKKLPSGMVNDWPEQGICSTPLVEGDRLYYATSRGEVVCLDTEGFLDGENDGPFKDEELTESIHADIIWIFNMMEEVKSFPHNMTASAPVGHGDLVFSGTSNGQDEEENLPSPEAPAIVALNKKTGQLVWSDNSVGANVLHGQWSSPAVGDIGGVVQVVMGQGDGWVRAYEALTGEKLWEFDTNPKESVWPKDRNNIISTPVIVENKVYIANGQDPEHGEGVGHFYCIDGTKRGDITESGMVWHYDEIRRSISTAAVHEGLVYLPDFSGFFHCLDAATGEPKFVHDTFAAVWGSPLVVDGKVYLGDEDGDVVVLKAGDKEEVIAEMNMEAAVYGSPVPANGVLFISSRNRLYAIEAK